MVSQAAVKAKSPHASMIFIGFIACLLLFASLLKAK
jgi:hypothetical protein